MINRIKEYLPSKIHYFALLLFILWLPLNDGFLPAIMTFWIFTWLLEGNFKERTQQFQNKTYYSGFLVYFVLTALSIIHTINIENGITEIQIKLSLAFFPIILSGSNKIIKNNSKTILIIFVIANIVASILCLGNAFIESVVTENNHTIFKFYIFDYKIYSFWDLINTRNSHFSYIFLSIFKHPSYFSMFIIFSIIIIIYFFKKDYVKKLKWIIICVSILLFFVFIIYLLQSRASHITFGAVLVLIPLVELYKKKKKRFVFISTALFIFILTFFLTISKIKSNIVDVIQMNRNMDNMELSESDSRIQIWYASIQVIKENFWFGTSPANLTLELSKKYNELGFTEAANEKLNCHNQYLETFAGLGIFGFLSLLFIMIYSFVISIKRQNYLLFFLMIILAINFMFESMMNRMAGILFMMFFISLLVFANIPEFEGRSRLHSSDK